MKQRNPGGCSIYKRCVLDFYLSFCITLYQNNNYKTASFFSHYVFDRNLLSNIMCSKMHRYRQAVLERHRHRRNAFARVCVCTEKFFFPDLVWWRAYFIFINNKTIWMNFCPFTNLKPIFFYFSSSSSSAVETIIENESILLPLVCVMSAVFSIN